MAPSSWHEPAVRLVDPQMRPARARRDDGIKEQIRRFHQGSFGLYGSRKVWHQMRREGIRAAKCPVERLMRAMGLAGVRRGKKTITTVSNPKAPCPLDKVNREFKVTRPNGLWVVDFAYVHTWSGFATSRSWSMLLPGESWVEGQRLGHRRLRSQRLEIDTSGAEPIWTELPPAS